MLELENRQILLLGLGSPGEATCEFSRLGGARVVGVDDPLHRYRSAEQSARADVQLFRYQRAFDWAILQSEAMTRLRTLDLSIAAKTVTFSADDRSADLDLEGRLLVSRLPNCSGPWLDMEHCQLRGSLNPENLLAALAVGHALRLALEGIDSLKMYKAGPQRFDLVAEIYGVAFFDDSKATNLDSLHKSARATRPSPGDAFNFWLTAGGKAQGLDFRDLGPACWKLVKRALYAGEPSERIRVAWDPFTPCTVARSLLKAVSEAAKNATSGDLVCSHRLVLAGFSFETTTTRVNSFARQ